MNPIVPVTALYSTSPHVTVNDVADIANALQIQQDRDWAPRWQNRTKVIATTIDKAPFGARREEIKDDIGVPGALGFHTDEEGQPMAFVDVNEDTSLTAGHELLEMQADPSGNRLVPALLRGKWVQYLIEVCDPIEKFFYLINGIKVPNFILPEYIDNGTGAQGGKYDFMGVLKEQMSLADGGYISYKLGGRWFQDQWFVGSFPTNKVRLEMTTQRGVPLRTQVDQYMMKHFWEHTV